MLNYFVEMKYFAENSITLYTLFYKVQDNVLAEKRYHYSETYPC